MKITLLQLIHRSYLLVGSIVVILIVMSSVNTCYAEDDQEEITRSAATLAIVDFKAAGIAPQLERSVRELIYNSIPSLTETDITIYPSSEIRGFDSESTMAQYCKEHQIDQYLIVRITTDKTESKSTGSEKSDKYIIMKSDAIYNITVTFHYPDKKRKEQQSSKFTAADYNKVIPELLKKIRPELAHKIPVVAPEEPEDEPVDILVIIPPERFGMFYSVSPALQISMGRYGSYTSGGAGLLIEGGTSDTFAENLFVSMTYGYFSMNGDKNSINPYYQIPLYLSAGYVFDLPGSKVFKYVPVAGVGLLMHFPKKTIYVDPLVTVGIQGWYTISSDKYIFAQCSLYNFYEQSGLGNSLVFSIGFRQSFTFMFDDDSGKYRHILSQ
jgi:hypothetical protein